MAKARDDLRDIKGIFFDYGGVIEDLTLDHDKFSKGVGIITGILEKDGIKIKEKELEEALIAGQEEYSNWIEKSNYIELPNEKIWTSFFLKKYCEDDSNRALIEARSEELSSIYEYYLFRRRPSRELVKVIKTLFYLGYTLSLVSNTISRVLIPERLKKYGIERFFTSIVLSMNVGFRKPSPGIFQEALKTTDLSPGQCIFIGDTLSRDIEGCRRAGFYRSVLLPSGITAIKDREYRGRSTPDYTIKSLNELLTLLGCDAKAHE
ncbi:MAG: HAD family hydrolase [Spirochaetota bacterium]